MLRCGIWFEPKRRRRFKLGTFVPVSVLMPIMRAVMVMVLIVRGNAWRRTRMNMEMRMEAVSGRLATRVRVAKSG